MAAAPSRSIRPTSSFSSPFTSTVDNTPSPPSTSPQHPPFLSNLAPSPLPPLFRLQIFRCSSIDDVEGQGAESHLSVDGNEGEGNNASVGESVDPRRLFVGNLPYSMTSNHLAEAFAEAGQDQSVEDYI